MEIIKTEGQGKITFALNGRLDTITAPEIEKAVFASLDGITELVFDFKKLEYISSAGLRVILKAQKAMNKQGAMKLINVSDDVMEIFDLTGFVNILTIEKQ